MKRDKQLHATVSYALYVTIFFFVLPYTNYLEASNWAFWATFLIGIGKELGDKFLWRGTPEWDDLLWNLLGIFAGTAVTFGQLKLPSI